MITIRNSKIQFICNILIPWIVWNKGYLHVSFSALQVKPKTGGSYEVNILEWQFSGQLWISSYRKHEYWISDLFENEIKSGVFWPIIAGLCPMKLPHLKSREKTTTSVSIRMYLGRTRQVVFKDNHPRREASSGVWEVPKKIGAVRQRPSFLFLRPKRFMLMYGKTNTIL